MPWRSCGPTTRASATLGRPAAAEAVTDAEAAVAWSSRRPATPSCGPRWCDYYHETLKQSPEALEYLESAVSIRRGRSTASSSASRTAPWATAAAEDQRRNGQAIRERLQELGIIKEHRPRAAERLLVVPIFDGKGQVVQMYGRKITPNLRKGTPKHLYLPGPRRGIWNLEALREPRRSSSARR